MSKPIYLDNQSTTPMDPDVFKAMLPFFQEKFGNASSIHHAYGIESSEAVEKARKILAESINAKKREITFTSGATEAINLAIKGVAGKYKNNRHLITQVTEHSAVLDTHRSMVKNGWDVTILPVNSNGTVEPQSVLDAINDKTVLVSVMHANNEIGTIQPVSQIGEICKKNNVLFFVDACQTYGKLEIDINKMNIDLLATTAHKLYGPKGVGFLYVRQKNPKVNIEMQIDGGGHEKGLRSGTLPVPLIVGFGRAAEISLKKRESEYNILKNLRDSLFRGIKNQQPDVIVNGDIKSGLSHNLNLCFPGLDSESLIMQMKGVACSAGSACSSANLEPSHVIKALGRNNELALSAVRFSVGRFNTIEEIDSAVIQINSALNRITSSKQKRRRTNF